MCARANRKWCLLSLGSLSPVGRHKQASAPSLTDTHSFSRPHQRPTPYLGMVFLCSNCEKSSRSQLPAMWSPRPASPAWTLNAVFLPLSYSVDAADVTDLHVISYEVERDLTPLILSNCQYQVEQGRETLQEFDLEKIQRQIVSRFLQGKPRLSLKVGLTPATAAHLVGVSVVNKQPLVCFSQEGSSTSPRSLVCRALLQGHLHLSPPRDC